MRERILSLGMQAFLFAAMLVICRAQKEEGCHSSCGNISNISFPFLLKGDPPNCGYPEYQLSCESNRTVLYLHSKKLWVEAIDYKNKTIRVVDSSLQSNDCSSLPRNSMTTQDLIYGDPYILPFSPNSNNTIFVNCSVQMDKDPASYIATTSCSNSTSGAYIYVLGRSMILPELHPSCKVVAKAPTMLEMKRAGKPNYREIHDRLMKGFELFWYIPLACRDCKQKGTWCTCFTTQIVGQDDVLCSGDPCYNPCRTIFQSWNCKFLILGICMEEGSISREAYLSHPVPNRELKYGTLPLDVKSTLTIRCLAEFLGFSCTLSHCVIHLNHEWDDFFALALTWSDTPGC